MGLCTWGPNNWAHRASRRWQCPNLSEITKKKRPKQPRCRGAVVWQLPHPPPNPFFLPPSPTGCRRSFTYDRWDEDLDATEGAERSSRSPTSDGETESRAAETPA